MTGKLNSELLRGSLDLMILSALSDGPQYGYAVQKRLAEASRDAVRLQAGTLYPILHRLEAEKLIRSKWDRSTGRPRKWYELTAAGGRRLRQQAIEWHSYVACLKQLLPSAGTLAKADAPPKPA